MKTYFFILLILVANVVISLGQKEGEQQFDDAEYDFLFEEYELALKNYNKLYENDSTNANINYRLGVCRLQTSNDVSGKAMAIPYLEYASQNITKRYNEGSYKEKNAPSDVLFYLGVAYKFDHKFDQSIEVFNKLLEYIGPNQADYAKIIEREIETCKNAKLQIEEPVRIDLERNTNISNSPEYTINCPAISADQNRIVFSRGTNSRLPAEMDVFAVNDDYELDNIYFSVNVDGEWSTAVDITEDLGADSKTMPASMNNDGTVLYLVRDKNDNGDIYVSTFTDSKWAKMEKLPRSINTRKWETHASITPDGRTLYYTSERKKGFGGTDIYKATLQDNGKWSKPENLGSKINTEFDEETPYITEDGKKLFYSSKGHSSMGGFDIFYSEVDVEKGWGDPINIGYPINTVGNDLYYVPIGNGEYAFYPFLYNRGEYIAENTFGMIKVTKPVMQYLTLNGIVDFTDDGENLFQDYTVMLVDVLNNDTVSKINPDNNTFNLHEKVDTGNYILLIDKEGYEDYAENINVTIDGGDLEIDLYAEMQPTITEEPSFIDLNNLLFEYDAADLKEDAKAELDKLYEILVDQPNIKVELYGYTDAKGTDDYNKELSKNRAQSAYEYLVVKGIDKDRVEVRAMGEAGSIALNANVDGTDNPEGRKYNRRVEINLIGVDKQKIKIKDIDVPKYLKLEDKERDKGIYNNMASLNDYVIQVMALKKEIDIDYFTNLSGIEMHKCKDGYSKYSIGNYNDYKDAKAELARVKELGYRDAFIRKFDDYKE